MIFLARHGESTDNAPPARIQGRRNPSLSEHGREQARELGEAVAGAGIAALYSSQMRRAHETALIAGERLGLEPSVDERLAEIDMGEFQGRLREEVVRDHPEIWARWWQSDPELRFPGGESVGELTVRVRAAFREIAAGPLPALVVCHGGVIRAALKEAGEGEPADVPNAGVFRVAAAQYL